LRLEALDAVHELEGFDSGNEALDQWLSQHARTATGQGTRTYVVLDDERVVGSVAIAPHLIDREVLPRSAGRGAPRQIPAILLAKLALDRSLQGQGLGSELMVVALETIVVAARLAGGRYVVVDAIDAAAPIMSTRMAWSAAAVGIETGSLTEEKAGQGTRRAMRPTPARLDRPGGGSEDGGRPAARRQDEGSVTTSRLGEDGRRAGPVAVRCGTSAQPCAIRH
jgi:hypothetical protein